MTRDSQFGPHVVPEPPGNATGIEDVYNTGEEAFMADKRLDERIAQIAARVADAAVQESWRRELPSGVENAKKQTFIDGAKFGATKALEGIAALPPIAPAEDAVEAAAVAAYCDYWHTTERVWLENETPTARERWRSAAHAALASAPARQPIPDDDAAPAVEAAARALIARMEEIYEHPAFKSVWGVSQMHVGPYTGPKWEDEANALKAALAKVISGSLSRHIDALKGGDDHTPVGTSASDTKQPQAFSPSPGAQEPMSVSEAIVILRTIAIRKLEHRAIKTLRTRIEQAEAERDDWHRLHDDRCEYVRAAHAENAAERARTIRECVEQLRQLGLESAADELEATLPNSGDRT